MFHPNDSTFPSQAASVPLTAPHRSPVCKASLSHQCVVLLPASEFGQSSAAQSDDMEQCLSPKL